MSKPTQKDLIFKYYEARPKQALKHPEVVDWATREWKKITGKPLRDPDRMIRALHSDGLLVKEAKGIYMYDPEQVSLRESEEFTQSQKEEILKRDGYKCAVCGLGEKDGLELHVDHMKSRIRGGKATIDNGQVLCSVHNYQKKTYNQTESGKRIFINLLRVAEKEKDDKMCEFCRKILAVYDACAINGHIKWE